MRVIQVFNQQRGEGGEDVVVEATVDMLRRRGVEVLLALKSSRGTESSFLRKATSSFSGVYNVASALQMRRLVREFRPGVVHAHNLLPNWSPAVLAAAHSAGVPTILHVHSQILTCPTWYHLRNGQVCERCLGGKEYWCALTNCRGSWAESIVYGARSALIRKARLLDRYVTTFITPSEFMRKRLVAAGYAAERIAVVPNMTPLPASAPKPPPLGGYVAFVGRLSEEKGIDLFFAAARRLPHILFKYAGEGHLAARLQSEMPPNTEWLGRLAGERLQEFYRDARALVVPSIGFETFCMAALEAMAHGRPVIAAKIGAIPELVEDGAGGILFRPGDADELAACVAVLWQDQALCERLGLNGRLRSAAYSEGRYFERLMTVYEQTGAPATSRSRPIRSSAMA